MSEPKIDFLYWSDCPSHPEARKRLREVLHELDLQAQVEEIEVPITGLPSRLDGLRIVQLSDLHLSRVVPLEHIQRAVATAQDLAGDLIAVTGDYVSNQWDDVRACASALSQLRAPLGVYAILGNRDYSAGASQVTDALTTAGLSV